VAAACEASFVRVNVLAGVVATDQGRIEGDAASVLRERQLLGADITILADVDVKHGTQLWGESLAGRAVDLVERALADGLIVTGAATGSAAVRADVDTTLAAVPEVPVLVGSGVTAENAAQLLPGTHGVIVGTAVEEGGVTAAPVDSERVSAFVDAARRAWGA
jgi:membrane complex biogenesis BtpA family protein